MKNNYLDKPILIVDDNKTNLLTLQAMLEDKGYTSVFSVLSAQEMYTFLEEHSIELILLDVVMPDIDGIEACETLRGNSTLKDLSIIMVTGDESDETLEKKFSCRGR
ncbi:response regulator [Sulfurimonas sp. MAG313]|nr:response regulator [Sulfurimonas sp. MAG313]MDF1881675.1 response regulator [Sulfurimonas sp. MAG313]